MPAPTNMDDVIDSRDVIARIWELEGELRDLEDAADEAANDTVRCAEIMADIMAEIMAEISDWKSQNGEELTALRAFAADVDGEMLIRESYWPTYAQELVEDVGDLPRGIPSYIVIDWAATADNLKVDYTEVDFDGVTYLVR
jgi:hypothetical protein